MQINAAISTRPGKGGGEEPGEQEWEEKNGIITSLHSHSASHPNAALLCKHAQLGEGLFHPAGKSNSCSLEQLLKTQRVQSTRIHPVKTESRRSLRWKHPHTPAVLSFPKILCFQQIFHGFKTKITVVYKGASANPGSGTHRVTGTLQALSSTQESGESQENTAGRQSAPQGDTGGKGKTEDEAKRLSQL